MRGPGPGSAVDSQAPEICVSLAACPRQSHIDPREEELTSLANQSAVFWPAANSRRGWDEADQGSAEAGLNIACSQPDVVTNVHPWPDVSSVLCDAPNLAPSPTQPTFKYWTGNENIEIFAKYRHTAIDSHSLPAGAIVAREPGAEFY